MDDVYAINVAKSQFRDGFNTGDPNLVLSVFAPTFTDMSDGRPSRYGADAGVKLRADLADLFTHYDAKINVIIIAIRDARQHGGRSRLARTDAHSEGGRRGDLPSNTLPGGVD